MANAIEMAINAAIGRMAENFAERAPALMEQLLTNLPPDLKDSLGQSLQIILSLKAQLDRIENQNRLIIGHLNIPDAEISETTNGHGTPKQRE